jgi:hypothetical protein
MATNTSFATSLIVQMTLTAGILVGIVCFRQSYFCEINSNAMQKLHYVWVLKYATLYVDVMIQSRSYSRTNRFVRMRSFPNTYSACDQITITNVNCEYRATINKVRNCRTYVYENNIKRFFLLIYSSYLVTTVSYQFCKR